MSHAWHRSAVRLGSMGDAPNADSDPAEDAADSELAATARAGIAAGEPVIPWEEVKKQAGLVDE